MDTTDHGSRPHVILVRRDEPTTPDAATASDTSPTAGPPPAEGIWNGPIPDADADLLGRDASTSTVHLDASGAPTRRGRARPEVPAPTWRALIVRDGGCTWPGCDAPPGWCDAAHLDQRWIQGAGISVAELALACRRHHRIIDRLELIGQLVDGHIRWYRPDQLPDHTSDVQDPDPAADGRSPDQPQPSPSDDQPGLLPDQDAGQARGERARDGPDP